ncbi:MAG TPA: protease modulator HflK, partial [Thermodesulfobacteriota bacterium]|nr:protease modulator HflK [Thermodesulfobacteriota bacterium]
MSLFRRIREFKKPTNGSGQGGVRRFPRVIFIYIVLGAWILLSSFYIVDADEQGVVKRFGKYNRTQKPGVHFKAPWPIESVLKPRVTEVKRIEIGFRTIDPGPPASYRHIPEESLMLTGDLNIVSSEFIVQYRIKNAEEYLFNVKDVDTTIRDAAEAAKRQ